MSDSKNESESIHSDNSTDDSPGSTVLWFGKHSGERLDKVVKKEISYAEWCRHPDQKRFRWYNAFRRLYESYEDWVEENEGPINPGNAVVWFGKRYKGNAFAAAYSAPGYIRSLLNDDKNKRYAWYYWLFRQSEKMDAWREAHRRGERPRGPSDKIRDIGEIVGRRDDGVADPHEDYGKDGFVVSDSDGAEGDVAGDAAESEASTHRSRRPGNGGHSEEEEGWETRRHTAQKQKLEPSNEDDSEEEAMSSSDDESEGWLSVDVDSEFDDDAEYFDDDSELLENSSQTSSVSHDQESDEDMPRPTRTRSATRKGQAGQVREEAEERDSEDEVEALTRETSRNPETDSRLKQTVTRRKRTVSYANLSDHDDRPAARLRRQSRIEDAHASAAQSEAEDSDPGPRPSGQRKSSYGKLDFSDDDMYQTSHTSSSRPASAPTTPRR